LNIPFPTKQHREQRASFKTIRNKEKETIKTSIPRFIPIPCQKVTFSFWLSRSFFYNFISRFPLRPEALIPVEQMETRVLQLDNYLKAVVQHETFAKHSDTVSSFFWLFHQTNETK